MIGRPSGPRGGTVLFYGPDHTLIARTTLDAPGIARAAVPAGGAVTVFEPGSPEHYTTFFGVEPGNELLVGDFDPDPFMTPRATLILPPSPEPTNHYQVGGDCVGGGGSDPRIDLRLDKRCPPGSQGLIARAIQPPANHDRFYIFDPDVLLLPDGTATIDGDWQPLITFDVAITGMPQGLRPQLQVNRHYQGARLYSAFAGDGTATSGVFNGSFAQATGGDGTVTRLSMHRAEGTESLVQEILEYRDGLPNELAGDVSSDLIAVPLDPFPSQSRRTGVQFSVTSTTGYDAVVANVEFEIDSLWTILAPPPTTTNVDLLLPPLPADILGPVGPHDITSVSLVDTAASYAEFIRDAEPTQNETFMFQPTAPRKIRISKATHVRD